MSQRLFSDIKIAEMEKRTVDRLLEAIEEGDKTKAKQIAQHMYNEFLGMHDINRNGVAAIFSFIGRRFGEKVLEEVMMAWAKGWWLPILEKSPKGSGALSQRIRMFVAGLRGHLQPLRIKEDDEKVVIQMLPCGTGGRLILEGKYEGPDALLTLSGSQRLTYGRANFPVYCAHEPPMEVLDIEKHGFPFVVVEPARELGKEPCSFIIYKDPSRIPKRYYERLALKKPPVQRDEG
jgi:hypothetical protein